MAARAFALHRRRDDPRRPARALLARRAAAVPGPRLRLRLHGARPRWRSTRRPASAPISTRRSPGSARSTATTPIRTTAAISSPPTTPRAWWCARPRPTTTRRRTRTAIAAANLVRLAVLAGDDAWREKADRLIEGVLGAAGENLIGHAALLNALDLRLRGAEIVVTGSGERADALTRSRARSCRSSTASCCARRPPSALPASHPARDKIAAAPRRRGVRVRRRAMLAAGHDRGATRPSRPRDGGAASIVQKLEIVAASDSHTAPIRRTHARSLFTLDRSHAGARAGRACASN